ncbi:MAG: carboxypeptidase-like regulatory domain-containing protein, partial [Ekhidna sp.]|nr:carboxypeptidase-like regulatory domain-containing protein [Ekhidna sp.]
MKRLLKHTLIAILLFVFMLPLAAQRPSGPPAGYGGKPKGPKVGYGKISGVVKDDKGELVPYATIKLLAASDSKLINGTIAGEDGKWVIKSIPEGEFKVSISFIGYQTIEEGPFTITGKGESYNLDNIQLSSSTTELEQVVVE